MENSLMRRTILDKINKIIISEDGVELSENDLLISSQMDSFSYTLFWFSFLAEYKIFKEDLEDERAEDKRLNDFLNGIDYESYRVKDLIDRVEECLK